MQYDEEYFDYQKNIGAFGGIANLFKFSPFLKSDDILLDFGCGGGYLLHHIQVQEKHGLEINSIARTTAIEQNLTVFENIDKLPDNYYTILISNHVLEHIECPLNTIKTLMPKLKSNGRVVFVVPHHKPDERYRKNDVNQHLYTWNTQTLGNLFKFARYTNIQVDVIQHAWPPNYARLYSRYGQTIFDLICRLYARYTKNYQIRIFAQKP